MLTFDEKPELTVYYDGSCPLCRREIALYQGLQSLHPIRWVDVSGSFTCDSGLTCEVAMPSVSFDPCATRIPILGNTERFYASRT